MEHPSEKTSGLAMSLSDEPSYTVLRCNDSTGLPKIFGIGLCLGLAYRCFRTRLFLNSNPQCPTRVVCALVTKGMSEHGEFEQKHETIGLSLSSEVKLLGKCIYYMFRGNSLRHEIGLRWTSRTSFSEQFVDNVHDFLDIDKVDPSLLPLATEKVPSPTQGGTQPKVEVPQSIDDAKADLCDIDLVYPIELITQDVSNLMSVDEKLFEYGFSDQGIQRSQVVSASMESLMYAISSTVASTMEGESHLVSTLPFEYTAKCMYDFAGGKGFWYDSRTLSKRISIERGIAMAVSQAINVPTRFAIASFSGGQAVKSNVIDFMLANDIQGHAAFLADMSLRRVDRLQLIKDYVDEVKGDSRWIPPITRFLPSRKCELEVPSPPHLE